MTQKVLFHHGRSLTLLLLICAALLAQDGTHLPFESWKRLSDPPILSPRGDGWESAGTFNPAVMERNGKIVMLYRAQDKEGTSRLISLTSTLTGSFHNFGSPAVIFPIHRIC
jgi:predicted GH43/DUF377 family glycosyl hydrolase